MIRWLRRALVPICRVVWEGWRPAAFAYGWEEYLGGRWVGRIETVYIVPRFRGQSKRLMRELLARTCAACRRRGLAQFITPIREDRPGVLKVGIRWAGYVPYAHEGGYVWCYVDTAA